MTERERQRELFDAAEAVVREQVGADRNQRAQERGSANGVDRPGPLEFDRNGFPLAQRRPSFVTRVARLLAEG